jgi:hypothetical protein
LENGKEIDLYDPSINLAIEYCGLYWHNENSPTPRDHKYHYSKYKSCLNKNIQLITIFEDEWLGRNTQVKNRLSALLNKNKNIYARKCDIKVITKIEANKFIDANHIQTSNKLGIHAIGLYYNNELSGVLTLGRHSRNSKKTVLDRLCFKQGISITGGASRLFKEAVKYCKTNNIKELYSWSDNRWSNGNIYKQLGFSLEATLLPDYSYVSSKSNLKRYSKQSQRKNNVKCPKDKTELQWANERGLSRIWDCGKICWKYEIK